ncbi:MAG: DUF2024 family protein [Fulvivirga sp.]|uniref:DUF2024 family protein n=1 Tax=Fulvivirga sp. TaxID=1931237 RepID=UPI0032ED24E8
MGIAVFDTYVFKNTGKRMHFDILVPEGVKENQVYTFGQVYLKSKGLEQLSLSAKECRFCHIAQPEKNIVDAIERNGFAILEMEGCD